MVERSVPEHSPESSTAELLELWGHMELDDRHRLLDLARRMVRR